MMTLKEIKATAKEMTANKRAMNTKHTPGPWKAAECGSIEFKDGFVGEAYDYNPGHYGEKQEELPVMANARLMAAAPELLEALKKLAQHTRKVNGIYSPEYNKAICLVKKIEGDEE